MTHYCGSDFVKCFFLSLLLCQVFSLQKQTQDGNPPAEIFGELKRDTSSLGEGPVDPLLKTPILPGLPFIPLTKSPLFKPYFMYPPFVLTKPIPYPPVLPSGLLINSYAKLLSAMSSHSNGSAPLDPSNPSLMSTYFKAKKDEFLTKLFEKLNNDTMTSNLSARSAPGPGDCETTKSPMNTYFLGKKYEFLDTLFKTLNLTAQLNATDAEAENATEAATVTTPKPTIVPADFWFPFAKLPKPTKAPKPTKPPKAKKVLKDALDTILLQSLLLDMGVDPKDASLNKRRVARAATLSRKTKPKNTEPEEELREIYIPAKIDPSLYSPEVSECLKKLITVLSDSDDEDSGSYDRSKETGMPPNFWFPPNQTDYLIRLDAFLDGLMKSASLADFPEGSGFFRKKPKTFTVSSERRKRSTFLDELLHRVTTTPSPTTTSEPSLSEAEQSVLYDPDCDFNEIYKALSCKGKCLSSLPGYGKATRSLIFKPFGSGAWIPQYLYASKMSMCLSKLMDTINVSGARESANVDGLKRSLLGYDADTSGKSSKDAALNMIISELTDLKNDIVEAFADGIQAQKDATPTQKPFNPAAKSFKKPFWGPKAAPTTDPVAPIQKRIDILNDVFDKLTKVEKTLIFTDESDYDPKLIANLTEILQATSPKSKSGKSKTSSKLSSKSDSVDPNSEEFYLAKLKQYLKSMYPSKTDDSVDK